MAKPTTTCSQVCRYISLLVVWCALGTGLVWGVVWGVMATVEDDIAPMLNWALQSCDPVIDTLRYFMMVLRWTEFHDIFALLKAFHIFLLLLTAILLAVVWRRNITWQPCHVISHVFLFLITLYNTIILVLMRSAGGGKVLSLFMLAFPHCLTRLFYLLWQPLALLLLVLLTGLLVARIFSRLHMISAFSVFPTSLLLLVSTHVLFVGVIWWSMSKACSACHTHHLPSSPFLTAHRGCSMDFPENSLAAFRPASRISSVRTLETDVQVSADGELFLLHDPHLARTTTVSTACPHIDPLHNASELNYHSVPCPLVSVLLQHGSLHVPLFSEFLKIAAAERMNVVFDLYRPVSGHNYEHRYVNMTLDALLQSGIDLSKVWWVRGGEDQGENPVIPARFSNLTLIGKTSQIGVDRFNALGISVANEEWTTSLDTLRKLQSQNVSVNMYTINSLLMYDYAWCAGVHSVTTDNCIMLDAHNHNYLYQVCHSTVASPWAILSLAILSLLSSLLLCSLPLSLRTKTD